MAKCTATLKKSMGIIEDYFLKDKKFTGGDQISIAGSHTELYHECSCLTCLCISNDVYSSSRSSVPLSDDPILDSGGRFVQRSTQHREMGGSLSRVPGPTL